MLCLLLAWAQAPAPPTGLAEPGASLFAAAERAADPGQAAELYRQVLLQDPGFLPAQLGLAYVLVDAGRRAEAEALYRAMGTQPDAVEALARLVEGDRPAEALALWRSLETLRLGDPTPYLHQARLLANTDPSAALAAWSTYVTLRQGAEPDAEVLGILAEALVRAERAPEAEALLRAFVEQFPEVAGAGPARSRLDRLEVERAARELVLGEAEALTPAGEAAHEQASRALAEGRADQALGAARALVADAPRSDAAHALLAEVLMRAGELGEAEVHATIAATLAPGRADHRIRRGEILRQAYGGRRDAEALEEFREAAALRPADPAVRFRVAEVERALRHFDRAAEAYQAVLDLRGEDAPAATARLAELGREPPPAPEVPAQARDLGPAGVHHRIALVYLRRGNPEAARAELELALAIAPREPALLNLRARLEREAGQPAVAEATLRTSIEADPSQAEAWFVLGELAAGRGALDDARAAYTRAVALGEADASWFLARLSQDAGDWDGVRAHLATYVDHAPLTSPYQESARRLAEEARRRWWFPRLAGGGAALAVVGLPFATWVRRRTARTLRDLLREVPECWHEAARPLAALRHEVLKHNTTVLPDVAAALRQGNPEPWSAFAARVPDVLARFEAYLDVLETLGERHGLRVDLRRRDPIVGPMWRALRRLRSAARWGRAPSPATLEACSAVINERGYEAIGRVVDEICILPVTRPLVEGVFARVGGEPSFRGAELPAFNVVVGEAPLQVRMFRADLEDILANLLRNALAAGAREVRVSIGEDADPITGHPWVELRVGDDAPGVLTNAMIRGRYIGRGLGLAVDLVNRHGGTIRVEPREGWKDIVVGLLAVEAARVEVEWTA